MAPVTPEAPPAGADDEDTFFVAFDDFPRIPLPPADVANGGHKAPLSAPPDSAAAAAEVIDAPVDATKRQKKNAERAMATKKAYQARGASDDGEVPPAPTFSTRPHLTKSVGSAGKGVAVV